MLDRLTSIKGVQFKIGEELGQGGEGTVYAVDGRPDLAIKVYKPGKISEERRRKLRHMASVASPELAKHAAWPVDLVDQGEIAVVMPRVQGIELHDLYGPKSRMVKMPKATFRFLVMAAYNLCVALDEIHRVGAVVGDFNQRNILVNENATVRFVDCDSFQIANGPELFRCYVGMPDQLAPELQGADLKTAVRTPNHDNFTLAVLIFQLLFIGRHPFAGVGGPDELSDAIRGLLFAYGKRGRTKGIRPPPHVPAPDIVPPSLFLLFERAFAEDSAKSVRPGPGEWAKQLQLLMGSLVKCRVNAAHEHIASRNSCPWCELRVVLFIGEGQRAFAIDAATVNELAEKLEAAAPYTYNFKLPPVGNLVPAPLPPDIDAKPLAFWFGFVLAALAAAGALFGHWLLAIFVGVWAFHLVTSDQKGGRLAVLRKKLESDLAEAERKLKAVEIRMRETHARYVGDYETGRRRVPGLKGEYNALPQRRQREIAALGSKLRDIQLHAHLDRYFISGAGISGIGAKRLAALRGCGIETAADVRRGMYAPGIGPDLKRKLMMWKQSLEATFHFNPNQQVDRNEVLKIDAALHIRRNEIESELRAINTKLAERTQRLRVDLEMAAAELPAAARAVAQARLNLTALEKVATSGGGSQTSSTGLGFGLVAVIGTAMMIAYVSDKTKHSGEAAPARNQHGAEAAPVQPATGTLVMVSNVEAKAVLFRVGETYEEVDRWVLNPGTEQKEYVRTLSPGRYRIEARADGWKQAKSKEFDVAVGSSVRVGVRFANTSAEFTSVPSGADVSYQGIVLGTTPFRLERMPAEEHLFTFSRRGLPDGMVRMMLDEKPASVSYVWPFGSVLVESSPSGADVLHAGTKIGTTPLKLDQVTIGDFRLEIKADGFERAELQGSVAKGETLSFHATLKDARPAKLLVRVASDRRRLLVTGVHGRETRIGSVTVRSGRGDFIDVVSINVLVVPQSTTEIILNSTIKPGMTVVLDTIPKDVDATLVWEPQPAPVP